MKEVIMYGEQFVTLRFFLNNKEHGNTDSVCVPNKGDLIVFADGRKGRVSDKHWHLAKGTRQAMEVQIDVEESEAKNRGNG
jgi:hypothetical protein